MALLTPSREGGDVSCDIRNMVLADMHCGRREQTWERMAKQKQLDCERSSDQE